MATSNSTLRKPFVFVLMPFVKDFDDIYKLGIKEAAKICDIKAERLDDQLFGEGMMERTYRQIDIADIIIADLSTRNANVFYELGYAHAKDKLCILITKDASDIPFDLKHRRHVVYGNSISFLKDELVKNITWAKSEIIAQKQNKIRIVSMVPCGNLTVSEHSAECKLDFTFDLYNDTNRISPEITALYLYAGRKWNMFQNGRECAFTESDIKPFKYRYFLSPPTSRIGKKAWCQVNCEAKRVLAEAWRGDEIKYEYPIGGRSILRAVTDEGDYDHYFDFNIIVSDIPF